MKPWKQWFIVAAILALVMGAGVAVAQLPNTLNVSSSPSGTPPAIRASGIDANISINLVPKGTGTVQVNGTPITVSGGTFTSLTVNPGPFAVTGTTNLTGPLFIQPGTNGTLKGVSARIFHNTTDAATTGVAIETLYTFNVPANTLTANGESLRIRWLATTTANANTKTGTITFGATTIWASTAQAFNNDLIIVDCDLFRTGVATQKVICSGTNPDLTTFGAFSAIATVTLPAEALTGAVTMLFRGTTPTAAGDLTARSVTIDWYPAGQ